MFPQLKDKNLQDWVESIDKDKYIKIAMGDAEEYFVNSQFVKCVYLDNKLEKTCHLSQYNTLNILSKQADVFSFNTIGELSLNGTWDSEGERFNKRQTIQHYLVLKCVWYHATSSQLVTKEFICNIHKYLMAGSVDENGDSFKNGEIRTSGVSAGLVTFMPAHEIKENLSTLIEWMNQPTLSTENIVYIFRQFLLIHPFYDGNGRTARILLNWLLCRHLKLKFPIVLTSGHSKSRSHYYYCLRTYDKGFEHHLSALLMQSLICFGQALSTFNNRKTVEFEMCK
eukprot:NODE_18_length_40692_cov_0.469183.p15 type:complete len:283 gc:universal NODE_18_length_40692_cov_0.469183:20354-19506(-)